MNKVHLAFAMLCVYQLGCSSEASTGQSGQENVRAAAAPELSSAELLTGEGLDCRAYDQYTAALATFTVDCLGGIAPEHYRVNESGSLARTFAACPLDPGKLEAIDGLLSLQQRSARLPLVRECIAGRYADYLRSIPDSVADHCPSWRKQRTVNPITFDVIEAVLPRLQQEFARLPSKAMTSDALQQPSVFPDELEEKNLYRVAFANQGAAEKQAAAGDAAAACAAGFAGFVLETNGDSVLTDPAAWLLDTIYLSASDDPFLRPGYFHPMSFAAPLPGAIFAHYNRFAPCGSLVCPPERCSYFAGGVHRITRLQADCLDPNDINTCVAYCGPPLP